MTDNQIEALIKSKVIKDSQWVGKSGGRCITDYTRTIIFEKELTEEDYNKLVAFLEENDCPGWTGITGKQEQATYRFFTTWDSSD